MSDDVKRVDPEEWFPNHKRGTHAPVPWEKYESLRAEISEKDSLITELRSEVKRLKTREITDEQIDAAWEYAHGHLFDPEVEICVKTLAKLGIDTERWRQCDPYREERGDE